MLRQVMQETDPLSREALAFVDRLQRELGPERERLLRARDERRGERLRFVRAPEEFTVAPAPADLQDRRVEITGPVERKMMINALNSGAKVFMADFEDANSPTWDNVRDGQRNVMDAVRREITLDTGEKTYTLNDEMATLVIRPRGWHLLERHHEVDGAAHQRLALRLRPRGLQQRARAARARKRAVLLPPEARVARRGAVVGEGVRVRRERARPAARIDQVHRPDRDDPRRLRDGRDPLRAARPLLRAERRPLGLHLQLHQEAGRGASRPRTGDDDGAVHARLLAAAREDVPRPRGARDRRDGGVHPVAPRSRGERRRAREGGRGQARARPATASTARGSRIPTSSPSRWRSSTPCSATARTRSSASATTSRSSEEQLVDFEIPGGEITDEGLRVNVSVGVRYVDAWLQGVGAAAIDNLMEDAATAEISRAQVWSWVQAGRFDEARVRRRSRRSTPRRRRRTSSPTSRSPCRCVDFLTTEAYGRLCVSLETTKADDIAHLIEEAIVSGELAPGSVLRQEQLSERFGVSRTPVREALRLVAALGLVSFEPNRGVRVRALSHRRSPRGVPRPRRARGARDRSRGRAPDE